MFAFILLFALITATNAQLSFTTCGGTTCTAGGNNDCATYANIPSDGSCQSIANGLYGVKASLANSPPYGFNVILHSSATCAAGTAVSTNSNLQATGKSGCQLFMGTSSAYATIATGYIEMMQLTGSTCAGTLLATSIVAPNNCISTPGSSAGKSYQINCGNVASTYSTSAPASVSYFSSSDCTGTATSTGNSVPNAPPTSCYAINTVNSVSSRCVSGATFSTPSGSDILTQTTYSNAVCPAAGLPSGVVVYKLNQCMSFNTTSSSQGSCSGGKVSLTQYTPSTTCSGGSQASNVSLTA